LTIELGRKLTLTHVTSLVIGTVIGSGIFITLPLVARETGSPWLAGLSWFLGGLIWIPQILIVVEMGTAYPQQGFGYLYLEKAGSPLLGFLYVWTVFLTSDTPSISIICITAISALATFSAVFANPWLNRILAILLIVLLTIPHYRDVRGGGNFQVVLTIAKLMPLLVMVILGLYYFKPDHFQVPVIGKAVHNSLFHILGAGVAATVWSYAGFPNILYMAGEIKSPGRTLPWSLISSVIFVTVAYAMISLAVSGIMPHNELAAVTGGFANPFAYLPIMANIAAGFLAIAAFISMLGAASACIMVQPRIEYALARDGLFFKPFAHIHPRYHTPDYSLLIQTGLAALLVLVGGLESLLGYFTLSYVVQNGLVYGAIFRLRKRQDYQPTFKAPAWRLMAVLSIAGQVFLVYGTFLAYSAGGVLAAAFLIATGAPMYYRFKRTSDRQ
jgi:fructoselysine transporter